MTKQQAIFWYDLETTGLSEKECGIHQMGIIIEIDDKVVEKANIKMQPLPGQKIEDIALDVAGITRDDLAKYQTAEDGFAKLVELLDKYQDTKFTLAGFNNIWFDNKHLKQLFLNHDRKDLLIKHFSGEQLDVFVEYKEFLGQWSPISRYNKPAQAWRIPEEYQTENLKLETLANHFDIEIIAHDGLSDIEATRELYYKVFRKDEEMHDLEYRDDHQQYHEQVVLKEELEHMDQDIEEEFENPTVEDVEPGIEDIKPNLSLTVQTIGEIELHENVNEYAEYINKMLKKANPDSMVVAQDFEIGANIVKTIKSQREMIKVANMALDNKSIAEVRATLNTVDSMLQKSQSAFEKRIKEHKEDMKEAFYKEAFKEITDSEKFGISYKDFHDQLAARVKGKRSQEVMNKEAEMLITEINTTILSKTQRFLEVIKVVKETFKFKFEECTDKMAESFADEYLERGFDDETVKLYIEKEINEIKEKRQASLAAETEKETVTQNKAHAMDRQTPEFALNVNMRVMVKASCESEAKSILQRGLANLNARVDTLEIN